MDNIRTERERFIRTREIEEWTNLVFVHPLSERFARLFDRFGIHPNLVSLTGMILGIAAGIAYHQVDNAWAVSSGFLLMIGWHVMDGADGQLARLSGKSSEIGKILDGLADHVAFTSVYIGLAAALSVSYGTNVWILVVVAGLSHAVQSAASEYQRQSYDFFVHRKASARVPPLDEWRLSLRRKRGVRRILGRLYLLYLYVQHAAAGARGGTDEFVERVLRTASDPDTVRMLYRRVNIGAVRWWSVLCSNYRTIALFTFCIAGRPLYYFIFEIVVMNGVLLLLTHMQRTRNRLLRESIADASLQEPA